MAKNAKTRRAATGGYRVSEELGGDFGNDNSREITTRQRDFVARRFGIAPHIANAISSLAFLTKEAAR